MNTTRTSHGKSIGVSGTTLKEILQEIRLLRHEVELLLPQEDLKGYAHPERIKQSYADALRQYPPS